MALLSKEGVFKIVRREKKTVLTSSFEKKSQQRRFTDFVLL